MRRSRPGIFAGGDAVGGGPATVIDAVAAGNHGAESIDRYLRGLDLRTERIFGVLPREQIASKMAGEGLRAVPRVEMPALAPADRTHSFTEIEQGLDAAAAPREAERCLDCTVCSECLACVEACGPAAIDFRIHEAVFNLEVGTIVLATGHRFFDPTRLPQYRYNAFPTFSTASGTSSACATHRALQGGEILTADGRMRGAHQS